MLNMKSVLMKQHFVDMLNDISELLHDVTNNNNQYVEKIPIKKGE